jgi:hypothetical protein
VLSTITEVAGDDALPGKAAARRLVEAAARQGRAAGRPGPKGHPPEFFATVADAYRGALVVAPLSPIKYLAGEFHASEATVHRWLTRARDQGHLGASIPGKAGERKKQS